ncbi:hypothetical protein BDZ45DRAFT_727547 [Acephala macrosclerotiorum]|nr:hypothetical protein BDZ45DRAFT_727547 [Acephala macrosclerotiorum]
MNADDARMASKKRQQMFRKRKGSLFGKAHELSEFTQVDVVLVVRHPQQEKFWCYDHIDEQFWPSGIVKSLRQLTSESEYPSSEDTEEHPATFQEFTTPSTHLRQEELVASSKQGEELTRLSIQLEQAEENPKWPNGSGVSSFLAGIAVGMAAKSVVQALATLIGV